MQYPEQGQQPPAVIVDTGMSRIDDVLALTLLFGFAGRREVREGSISLSRYDLAAAAFCDVLRRFYAGNTGDTLPVGLTASGRNAAASPMVSAALAKRTSNNDPVYPTTIRKLTDTASGAVVIRNSLAAQRDQNGIIVLAGPATNLAKLLDLPGGKALITRAVRFLSLSGGAYPDGPAEPNIQADIAAARKVLAEWPTPIVAAGREIGDALLYPAASIEKDFTWAPDNPAVDAYRAYRPMPYDAPTWDMTPVLYAARPGQGLFDLSPAGTIAVDGDGRTKFAPSLQGRHRYLILNPAQKERILGIYTEVASSKPVQRQRFSTLDADKKEKERQQKEREEKERLEKEQEEKDKQAQK
jgi:inosine-uridine nucleoside N-ribohydrolase